MTTKIRILIADDHDALRAGLCAIFAKTEFDVVAQAKSGKEAFQLALEHEPSLALLDVRMPDGDGLNCLARIKLEIPQTQVVMFSGFDNPTFLARAVALGAAGYVLKDVSREELLRSVRSVTKGEQVWPAGGIESIASTLTSFQSLNTDEEIALTKRESEVLKQMSFGLSNREISQLLGISYETVKEHVQHILQKLGVADRTQAAVWAVRRQII